MTVLIALGFCVAWTNRDRIMSGVVQWIAFECLSQ